MGQTCCLPPPAPTALMEVDGVLQMLHPLVPLSALYRICAFLCQVASPAELAVSCVLHDVPGATVNLPVGLQAPCLPCRWQFPADVTPEMRVRVVEWLMCAADSLQLDPEWRILHRCVLLLDCCMQRQPVQRCQLQTLAVACLRLASKYEDAGLPLRLTAERAADITNGACTPQEITLMEWQAFQILSCQVGMATTWEWAKELVHRQHRRLTDLEWYRLDYSLLGPCVVPRHVAAERVLGSSVLVSHPLLKKRYPDLALAPEPPSVRFLV